MAVEKNPVGRPKKKPTKNITFRVPLIFHSEIKEFIREKIKEFLISKKQVIMYDDPYYNETECPECGCPCSVFDEICEL